MQDRQGSRWLQFGKPHKVVVAEDINQVRPALARIEKLVNDRGLFAAGFISYEASPAFDQALQVRAPGSIPLLWFGLFDPPTEIPAPKGNLHYSIGDWKPSIVWDEYRQAISLIKEHIAAGDSYQVNYTFRLRAYFAGDPLGLFLDLNRAQESDIAAYLDIGRFAICSASPELFFELDGYKLTARPMKGTARRGRVLAEDHLQADWLCHSEKNRAENVMIVDMIRNDMGRVCEIGTVCVPSLFDVERYPTLWQMTSTVIGETVAPVASVLAALFPCASITGAPKVRTMRIIADLESAPRGVYSGCIGYISPGRRAQFNVAIRTVTIDKDTGLAEYGVGGGIVWDSDTENEFEECQTKAKILFDHRPAFQLLESFLWRPNEGYFLLEEHLGRIADSAAYFGFRIDEMALRVQLVIFGRSLPPIPHKVRLLVNRDGTTVLNAEIIHSGRPLTVGLAAEPVDSKDIFLYHKTTERSVYTRALSSRPDCHDVLLWNERGEVTEASSANVVIKQKGELLTPPIESGLLPGTYRGHLMDEGVLLERTILIDDLWQCEAIFLINSVRKWREAKLVP